MSTGEQVRPAVEHKKSDLDFETLLSDLSSRFVSVAPDEVDHEIESALGRVCELLDLDLAVLWQWSAATPGVIAPTHSHPATHSGAPPAETMREDQYPWVRRQMLAGRTIVLSSLDELPSEAAVDLESARASGLRSNLTLPLSVGGEPPIGALAFSTVRAEREWAVEAVNRLRLVVQVLANALARRRRDRSLKEREVRLAVAADLAELGFYEVALDEGAMHADARVRDLCGVPPGVTRGLEPLAFWMEHLHPDDLSRVLDLRQRLHDGRVERISVEYRYLHPARGERWIQHAAGATSRDSTGRALRTFGVLRDITPLKQAESESRELSQRLIQAHEDERALLARELHDDVTQRLAVLAIDMGRAEGAGPDGAQAEAMRSVREGLVRLSEDIHALAYQLHPSVLEELGLVEALRAECERVGGSGGLELVVELGPAPAGIGKEAALCLFRVAQESLNNAARHARARSASVTLRQMDDGLLLAVCDDGIGFDPTAPGTGRHLGLASMRERVRLVAGTLDVESAPGQGTSVVVWTPVQGGSP